MGIGAGIFVIALGAILAFAVDYDIGQLDIEVVGWILMIVGVVGVALFLTVFAPRRGRDDGAVVEERRVYDDRPPGEYYDEPRRPRR